MTLSMGSTPQATLTNRPGGTNLAALAKSGIEQFRSNLLGSSNPYFEPHQLRMQWNASVNSSDTTSFTTDTYFSAIPVDAYAGSEFYVKSASNSANIGCTGHVLHNTAGGIVSGANTGSLVTFDTACATPLVSTDSVTITMGGIPTTTAEWSNPGGPSYTNGGGCFFTSDITTQYQDGGRQSLVISLPANTYCKVNMLFDTNTIARFVSLDGMYTGGLAAKTVSGSPSIAVSVQRAGSAEACNNNAIASTSAWARTTFGCMFSENTTLPAPGAVSFVINVQAGSSASVVELDSASFEKTSPRDVTNGAPTWRDEFVAFLKSITPQTGLPGSVRDWIPGMQGWTLATLLSHSQAAAPVVSTFQRGSTTPLAFYLDNPLLFDYLKLCEATNNEPYFAVPITFRPSEWAGLMDYLFNPSNADRIAQGHPQPWTGPGGVFKHIRLPDGNEDWNNGFIGAVVLGGAHRYDNYFRMAAADFVAARSASAYVDGYVDFIFNLQVAIGQENITDINAILPTLPALGRPNAFEGGEYYMSYVADVDTTEDFFRAFLNEYWMHSFDPSDVNNWYQTGMGVQVISLCYGSVPCRYYIYEQGKGITFSCSGGGCGTTHQQFPTQDQLTAADSSFATGMEAGLLMVGSLKYRHIAITNYFGDSQVGNTAGLGSGLFEQIYSNVSDVGGGQSAYAGTAFVGKPQALVYQVVNAGIAGPNLVPCNITNLVTNNFAATVNGPVNAVSNVPQLETICTKDGSGNQGVVIFNTSMTTPVTLGLNDPMFTGTVSVKQVAAAPGALNTASGNANNATTAPNVLVNNSTMTNATSVTIPAFSATAFIGSAIPQRWYFAAPRGGQ